MTKMPALFIGHGSPMNTLELNLRRRRLGCCATLRSDRAM